MCSLLILGEDHRFYFSPSVDPAALCRATWRTGSCGHREGGSTIAMQLVRALTRKYDKPILRKTREISLAVQLTQYIPREDIPGLCLWVAYYGWRAQGQVKKQAHHQRRLNRQRRIGVGGSPPGRPLIIPRLNRLRGKPHRQTAPLLEPRIVSRPVPDPIDRLATTATRWRCLDRNSGKGYFGPDGFLMRMGGFFWKNSCPIYKGACLFATPNPTNTYLFPKANPKYKVWMRYVVDRQKARGFAVLFDVRIR